MTHNNLALQLCILLATNILISETRPTPFTAHPDQNTTSLIISLTVPQSPTPNPLNTPSLQDVETLDRVEKMCNGEHTHWSVKDSRNQEQECRFSTKPCRRIFRRSLFGIAGDFTETELALLERCIPDGILYIETDAFVVKAEGPSRSLLDHPPVTIMSREDTNLGNKSLEMISAPGEKTQDVHVALWNHYGTNTSVGTGSGVNIYILDSGIHPTHREFLDWSGTDSRASFGHDFVDDDEIAEDCDGHGTHVASTAIGRSVGIAKQAKVIGVRVLDCQGSGNISTTVAGLDWVTANYQKPAVVALSLGVSIGKWSQSLEDSVRNLIENHEIPVVVASGNSGVDSCYVAPANVPQTITVAASDLDTKFGETKESDEEAIYRWSNTGKCVDIFAPGVDVYGACGGPRWQCLMWPEWWLFILVIFPPRVSNIMESVVIATNGREP